MDWSWRTFDDVARVASDLVDPAGYQDAPHIAPNHIESQTGRLLPFSTIAADGVTSAKHRFTSGQILYSKIRPYLAKVVIADFDGLCSADMYPIETSLDPRFLKWWMLTGEFTRAAAGEQARTVLPKINKRELGRLRVPVPSLEVQRSIVAVLEVHLSRLDVAEQGLKSAQRRLEGLRERSIREALFGADVPGPRLSSILPHAGTADGELPDLPEGWQWSRLGKVADVVGGITKDAKKQADPSFVEVPYLRVANVQRGSLNLSNVGLIRAPVAKAESLRLLPGDVLLNEGGDRDKLARGWVWEGHLERCIHQNHVFRARITDERVDPYFLSWTANTFGGDWAQRNGKQSVNLASISLSMVRNMPVVVPPAGEAIRVMADLEVALAAFDRLGEEIDRAGTLQRRLRESLLAQAFSGQLRA